MARSTRRIGPSSSRGGDGNGGVAQIVKSTPGAIGYVDYADAKASGLSFADVQNAAGKYIAPSTTAASAAAAGAKVASNLTFAAVWSGDATAYPITYQSWDLVFAKQKTANDVKMLKAYLGYSAGAYQQAAPRAGAFYRAPFYYNDRRPCAAQQDHLLIVVSTMAHIDQIGSPP